MTDTAAIQAKPREVIGKANRRLAVAGQVPAVLYGAGRDPLPIAVDRHDLEMLISHHAGSSLLNLKLEGEKKPVNAVIKAIQTNSVKGRIEHVDFLAVRMDEAITTTVTVHFIGESVGEKAGGVLMHNVREVTINALPGNLPEALDVDVSGLDVGDSLHVSDLQAQEGVTVIDDPGTVICTVTVPTIEPAPEEEAAAAMEQETEPKVIGEETESAEEG